jgi:hypothetical protein
MAEERSSPWSLKILEWNNNSYTIDAQRGSPKVPFWSFQSGSYERRPNWLVPLHTGFSQAQLWWSPLSAVPDSKLLTDEPDLALKNRDGSRRKISWWNSYYLCPANSRVVEYHKALVHKILVDWGFDGLKLDGQHMNGVPACYSPSSQAARGLR